MTEIFVSYSRRNKVFTENFIKALGEKGYSDDDIWVDWQDIPPSSKWEDEIRKGIESTNAVVFILSPDWMISNECAKELQIAVEYNKRLFPIVHQNIDPNKTPPALASLNWIFFRETEDFDTALGKLLSAINTDLDWVKQHTVLLKRSNEWESRNQDNSFLLRGSELQDAELWLSKNAEDKEPHPTPAQKDYIFASRKDATKRQRNALIGVSTALVVSIVLAISAVLAGFQAMRQSQQALSSHLAAQSINYLKTQPDLSLLLSIEANYIGDTLGETDPDRFGSLITNLNSIPKLETYLRGHKSDVRAVAFSQDGHWLASTGNAVDNQGQVLLWDMTSPQNPKPYQTFIGGSTRLLGLDFNLDGSRFAAAGDESMIHVWDAETCCEPVLSWNVGERVRALSYVQLNGREYIAVSAGKTITFWNALTGEQETSRTLDVPSEDESVRILSIAYSYNKNLLAVGTDDGQITVWDLKNRKLAFQACSFSTTQDAESICKVSGGGETDIRGLSFNRSGSLLASGSSDHHVWLWDTRTGKNLAKSADAQQGGHINTVANVNFNPHSGTIASVSWDNTIRLWKPKQTGEEWVLEPQGTLVGHSNSVWAADFSPSGEWLATGSSEKTVILWSMNQISQIGNTVDYLQGEIWAMASSPDQKLFSAADLNGNIRTWDFDGKNLNNPRTVFHEGGVLSLAYSNDNKLLASAGETDNAIRVWDANTGQELWAIENAHPDEIWSLAFSPDNQYIASASFDNTVKIWDVASHQLVGEPLQHDVEVFTLAYSKDGSKLMVAGYTTEIFVWDISNLTAIPEPKKLEGHAAVVNLIAQNPQYPSLVASTSDDKTLLVWDLNTFEHTPQVLGLNESMEAVAFRPSGDWMASATNNNTVLLWQLDAERCAKEWNSETCQPKIIGSPLVGSDSAVKNIIFLSDSIMVSSSESGQIILWNLEKEKLYTQACQLVNREFNAAENGQYIEGKVNHRVLNFLWWVSGWGEEIEPQIIPTCASVE